MQPFELMGRSEPNAFDMLSLESLGMLVFFAVSGYPEAQSEGRNPQVARLAAKRFTVATLKWRWATATAMK